MKEDLFCILAKSAPDVQISLSVKELRDFAKLVRADAETPARLAPRIVKIAHNDNLAVVLQNLARLCPDMRISMLAAALGVSRMWIHKLLAREVHVGDVRTEADEETLGELLPPANT